MDSIIATPAKITINGRAFLLRENMMITFAVSNF